MSEAQHIDVCIQVQKVTWILSLLLWSCIGPGRSGLHIIVDMGVCLGLLLLGKEQKVLLSVWRPRKQVTTSFQSSSPLSQWSLVLTKKKKKPHDLRTYSLCQVSYDMSFLLSSSFESSAYIKQVLDFPELELQAAVCQQSGR